MDMAMRFMDIRKRVYTFPQNGRQGMTLSLVPTSAGTGSEVTPFRGNHRRGKQAYQVSACRL